MSLQTFHIASDQWELTAALFPGGTHLLFINTTVRYLYCIKCVPL